MATTYNDLYLNTRKELLPVSSLGAALEAREIVRLVTGKNRAELVRDAQHYASEEAVQRVRELLDRRLKGEPIAYLLGEWEFYGLTLIVDENVLIPRVDTEVLADVSMHYLREAGGRSRLLDLCCGSGCVGLAALSQVEHTAVTMADISENALRIARKNVRKLGYSARCTVLPADVTQPAPALFGRFHVIACNPPYIPTKDIETLDISVRGHEPRVALDGGVDGLDFIRSVADGWKSALLPGGRLLLEVGIHQAQAALEILRSNGFEDLLIWKDSNGIDRVVGGSPAVIGSRAMHTDL